MERYELPDGWLWSSLGECCFVNTRDAALKKLTDDTIVSFVPMAAVDADQGIIANPVDRRYSQVRKGFTPFSDGDVIFAKITPSMENGKAAIARGLTNGFGFGSTEFHVMRPKDSAIAEWVFHFIRQQSFRDEAKGSFTGTAGQLRVPEKFILDTAIPLAPVPEQQRIIAKIESLFEQSRTARAALTRVPTLVSQFRRAVLISAMSGRLTEDWRSENSSNRSGISIVDKVKAAHELAGGHKAGNAASPTEGVHDLTPDMFPDGWVIAELRELVRPDRPITYGILKPGPDLSDGIPYIRVADYPNDKLSFDRIKRTSQKMDQEFKRSRLESGDILLSIRGTVGRLIIIPPELTGANITQDSARISVQANMNRDYVLWYLRSEIAQSRMRRAVKGVAVRGINIGDVRALQISIPSLEEQTEIVRRIEAMFAQADIIEQAASVSLGRAEQVDQSILARAFRGDLA